jgi:molybdopterin molybdotransferase
MNRQGAMIPYEEALAKVLASARFLGEEWVPLAAAAGRVLAADVAADRDQPPFDKSAMDGFACRRADLPGPLNVVETVMAGGVPSLAVVAGGCTRIMTGAPVPAGADCVVKFEDTEILPDGTVRGAPTDGRTNICRQGEDLRRGDIVLARGVQIAAPHVAVLASVGAARMKVARRPRVAIIATGDELVAVDARPGPGQIRNSNGPQLVAQTTAAGGVPRPFTPVGDQAVALREALAAALAESEVVVLSGGVSAGDLDLVPQAMRDCGLEIRFDSIAMQPGRPTTFAVKDGRWCFGLPGNPVSTFVQFEVLVRPLLARLMGGDPAVRTFAAPLAQDVTRRTATRQAWLPVAITAEGEARPLAYHGSAHIHALCRADGFIVLPVGTTHLDKGALVHVRPVPAAH